MAEAIYMYPRNKIVHKRYKVIVIMGTMRYVVLDLKTNRQYHVDHYQLRDNKIIDTEERIKTAYPHLMSLWQ